MQPADGWACAGCERDAHLKSDTSAGEECCLRWPFCLASLAQAAQLGLKQARKGCITLLRMLTQNESKCDCLPAGLGAF